MVVSRDRGASLALAIALASCGGSVGTRSTSGSGAQGAVGDGDGGGGASPSSDASAGTGDDGSGSTGVSTTSPESSVPTDGAPASHEGSAGDASGGVVMPPPPDDGPWPADHYPIPQMTDLGGTVLSMPDVVTVTFVGNSSRDALRAFDDRLVQGSDWWNAITAGYGVGKGRGGTYVELPAMAGGTMSDAQLQGKIAQWVGSGALPTPDSNTLFVMYFASSTSITLQGTTSCRGFGGYHTSTQIPLDGGVMDTAYAVIPDCGGGMQGFTSTTSHEIAEATVDPHVQTRPAWYGYNDAWFGGTSSMGTGAEVADVCERFAPISDSSNDVVSRSWVNQAAAASHDPCQPEASGEIYYAAAVPTQTIQINGIGIQYMSDGYLVMKAGDSQTLDVVVFSEAKLPNDVTLTVGKSSRGAFASGITTGVTTSLSPTTGHNGVHVAFTLQVATSVAAGTYPFVVRAALNANDHHDWPVILKVQ